MVGALRERTRVPDPILDATETPDVQDLSQDDLPKTTSLKTTSLAALLALGATLALSALPAAAQGTPSQRSACMGDAMSLCGPYIPDEGRVGACLRRERARVSSACQQAMASRPPRTSSRRPADGQAARTALADEPRPQPLLGSVWLFQNQTDPRICLVSFVFSAEPEATSA